LHGEAQLEVASVGAVIVVVLTATITKSVAPVVLIALVVQFPAQ
jgi:hypothetical protein